MNPKILVISGSRRTQSLNTRLARLGAGAIERAGGTPTLLDIDRYPLPLYDGDVEQSGGLPAAALDLKAQFNAHHGVLVVSPEYNASIAPLLKNLIDWVSRPTPSEEGHVPYKDKVAAMASVTPSPHAGIRGLMHLRQVLSSLGTWVVPNQYTLGAAREAFAEDGTLRNPAHLGGLEALCAELVAAAAKTGRTSG